MQKKSTSQRLKIVAQERKKVAKFFVGRSGCSKIDRAFEKESIAQVSAHLESIMMTCENNTSFAGIRTRVSWVKAKYPKPTRLRRRQTQMEGTHFINHSKNAKKVNFSEAQNCCTRTKKSREIFCRPVRMLKD